MTCRLTIIRIILTSLLFVLITTAPPPFVREYLSFSLAFLVFIVAPGLEVGLNLLTKKICSRWIRCHTKKKSLDSALKEIGQMLGIEHLSGVTYDLPKGSTEGTHHLHISLMLFRVADKN
jgi:hypothetical protein